MVALGVFEHVNGYFAKLIGQGCGVDAHDFFKLILPDVIFETGAIVGLRFEGIDASCGADDARTPRRAPRPNCSPDGRPTATQSSPARRGTRLPLRP